MNKARRKILAEVVTALGKIDLEDLEQTVADVAEEEREGFDNLSEGLQASENGKRMETAADALVEAQDAIEEARSCLETAISKIDEASE